MERYIYDDMVKLIRDQKHDYLNHLQVIMGNLQLEKRDKALNYLRQVTSNLLEVGPITKLDNSYLSILLLIALQKSRNLGVNLCFNIEPPAPSCRYYRQETIDFFYLMLNTTIDYIARLKQEENWLKVTYKEDFQEPQWELTMAPILAYGSLYRSLRKKQELAGNIYGSLSINQPPGLTAIILSIPKNN